MSLLVQESQPFALVAGSLPDELGIAADRGERHAGLDNVVANAGYATFDNLADGDPAGWRDMVLTNVLGPALLIRAALPDLKRSRGRIILIGSSSRRLPG